ncbi:MAG: AAA family ATPase [Pseudomonadota bacterium]
MPRIFLSSPSDVKPEREAAARVVRALNAKLPVPDRFELVAWERSYYTADATFQDQIARSSECDLVICIFWKRLGSQLPEKYRRPDGSLPTGTEFEFEDALQKATGSTPRTPDVLVYRKTAKVHFSEDNLAAEQAQRESFLRFWRHWFHTESGHFAAGFHDFEDTRAFEALLAAHLDDWAARHGTRGTWQQGSPFRGLAAFDVADAPLFFGRARETDRARARLVTNALKGCRFLLIQGPSGSGKSSVARAGLLARLKASDSAGGLPALDVHVSVTPAQLVSRAASWQAGLAQALAGHPRLGPALAQSDFAERAAFSALIASGGKALRPVLEGALRRMQGGGLCLLVDQLEEHLLWPVQDREDFGVLLAELTESPQIFVLATMRSEYAGQLADTRGFRALVHADSIAGPDQPVPVLDIRPPSQADIREIIAAPAELAGLSFEGPTDTQPDLATRIDAETASASLPALQYLLTQLYDMREGDLLTHAAYDQLGGVAGVLAARGNAVLEAHPGDATAVFTRVARQLVDVSAPDRPATARSASEDAFADDVAARSLIADLRDAGLLRQDKGVVRLAHETLLRDWDRLANQITEERRFFVIRAAVLLVHARALAQPAATAREGLLQGLALAEAEELLTRWGRPALEAASPGVVAFITASAQAEARRRRLRVLAQVAVGVLVAGAVLGGLWLDARRQTAQLEAQAQANLAEITQLAILNDDWDRAAANLLRLEDPGQTARTRALALAVANERGGAALVSEIADDFVSVAAAPEGGFATLTRTGVLQRGDRVTDLPTLDRFGARYFHLHPRGDGSTLLLTSDGHVSLVSADGADVVALLEETRFLSLASSFDVLETPDGFLVGLADAGGPGIVLRCTGAGDACAKTELPSFLTGIAFLSEGKEVALTKGDLVWIAPLEDPNGKVPAQRLGATILSFARLDKELLTGLADGTFVDVRSGQAAALTGQGAVTQVAVHPDGGMAFACGRGLLCAARSVGGALQVLYPLKADPVSVAWDAAGAQVAVALTDGTLQVWDVGEASGRVWALPGGPVLMGRALPGAEGTVVVATATTVAKLEPASGRLDIVFDALAAPVTDLAVGPQGQIAVALQNGVVWREDGAITPTQATDVGVRIERLTWDNDTLFGASGRSIMRWPPTEAAPQLSDPPLPGNASIGGVLRAGDRLVYGRSDGALLEWNEGASTPVVAVEQSADSLAAMRMALSPSGRFLATNRADDLVRLYDLQAGTAVEVPGQSPAGSVDVAFSPDGTMFAVLASDDTVAIWTFDEARQAAALHARFQPVPGPLRDTSPTRQATSIDWVGDQVLMVTARAGFVLHLDIRVQTALRALEK